MARASATLARNQQTTAVPAEGNSLIRVQSKANKARQAQRIGRVFFLVFILVQKIGNVAFTFPAFPAFLAFVSLLRGGTRCGRFVTCHCARDDPKTSR